LPEENESIQIVPSTSQVEKDEPNVDDVKVKEASDPDIIVQSAFYPLLPIENESILAVPSTSQVEKKEPNVDNVKEASERDIIVQSTFGLNSFEDEEENTVEVPDESTQVTEKSTGIWNYFWSYRDSNVNDKEIDPNVKTSLVEDETKNVVSWSNVDDNEPTLRHVRRG